jgi:pimeloyl-ACP methyl ester carboxylesterase
VVLAERDGLFPAHGGSLELARFGSATDRELVTVPDAGHLLFLHPTGRNAVNQIVDWLRRHPKELPSC